MADDLKRNAKVPYSREWLERVRDTLSEEIAKSVAAWPQHYATLGLDPDYLMYKQSSIVVQLDKEFGTNVPALCAFYWYCYWRIWLHRPVLVVQKIMGQMATFYTSKCPAYRLGKFLSLTSEYKRSVTDLRDEADRRVWMAYRPAVDAMRRTELLVGEAPVIEQPAYIRRPLSILAATYLPLLLIALALSAAVFLNKEIRSRLGWLAGMVIFAYSYNAANCLEVAIVHSLDNPRYLTVQMFFVILAQFLATLLILETVLESRALIGGKSSMPSGRAS